MQAALAIDWPAWDDPRRRLAVCMAISTAAMLILMSVLDWPPRVDWSRLAPGPLEISIRPAPVEPEAVPRELLPPPAEELEPAEATTPAQAAARANVAPPADTPTAAERPPAAAEGSAAPPVRVDWYAELERAAAEVSARAAAEPQSMHPEFDELRRIAALRYGKPQAAPAREEEDDPYGRPPRFRNLVNDYAFGTFDSDMLLITIPFGRAKPKNLPWVETIRARYAYFLEPDELPPIGSPGGIAAVSGTPGTAAPPGPGEIQPRLPRATPP